MLVCSRSILLELTRALADAIADAIVPGKPVELWMIEEAFSEKDRMECDTFSTAAELAAILATQWRYGGSFISWRKKFWRKGCR